MTTARTATLTEEASADTHAAMTEPDVGARSLNTAIDQFGRHGFDTGLQAIADAADVNQVLILHHFGSKEGLRKACDDYILESIRATKSEAAICLADDLVLPTRPDRLVRADDGLPGAKHVGR